MSLDLTDSSGSLATADLGAIHDAGPFLLAYRYALAGALVDDRLRKLSHAGEVIYTRSGGGGEATQAAMAVSVHGNAIFARPGCLASVLAAGLSIEQIFLSVFARAADPNAGGRMLPQLWNSVELGIYSTSPSAGAQVAHAAGLAWNMQRTGTDACVVAWIDDADARDGSTYEAIGFAADQKLPLVIVHERRSNEPSFAYVSSTLATEHVVSHEVIAAHNAMVTATQRASSGRGPTLLTVHVQPHAGADEVGKFADLLVANGVAPYEHFLAIESAVRAEIDLATRNARAALAPAQNSVTARVHAPIVAAPIDAQTLTTGDALRQTQRQLLLASPDVVLFTNCVPAEPEWMDEFGPSKVISAKMPARLSIGLAIGASMGGAKPIVQLAHASETLDAFAQLANEAAWMRYRTNGELAGSITIRAPWGAGFRTGPYHARGVEAFFAHVPGLMVLAPSTPTDATAALVASVGYDGPVLLCEHRVSNELVEEELTSEPFLFGKASIARAGTDATIITYGAYRHLCLRAAEAMKDVSIEVIDLVTISPLDVDALLDSVERTSRVLIVTEDTVSFGVGAEVSAIINEEAFDNLHAPVRRLALPDAPQAAFATELDSATAISVTTITAAVRSLLAE